MKYVEIVKSTNEVLAQYDIPLTLRQIRQEQEQLKEKLSKLKIEWEED